tara:strand:- start:6 stop:1229 length:1224 start_codon:yes stop_codon:yes gene_type:complete
MKIWNVTHRGKKVYQVVIKYEDPNGLTKIKKFLHPKRYIAIENATKWEKEYKNKTPSLSDNGYTIGHVNTKLEKEWDKRIELKRLDVFDQEGLEEDTVERYKDSRKALFKILGNGDEKQAIHFPLSNITYEWYSDFLDDMFAKHKFSKSKAKRVRNFLNSLLTKAEQLNWFQSPHHRYKEKPTQYRPLHQPRAMTPKEAKKLLISLENTFNSALNRDEIGDYSENGFAHKFQELSFIYIIQYPTGIRWGEAAGLSYEDFNWHNLTITIRNSRNVRNSKITPTKAAKLRVADAMMGERIVPIPKKLKYFFDTYTRQKCIKSGHLFDVGYKYSLDYLKSKCDKLGFDSSIVDTKMFRRFIISEWQKSGVDSRTIALRVGHNDTKTQIGYATFSDPNAQQDMSKLIARIY